MRRGIWTPTSRTELHYAGSDGISPIGLTGDVDIDGPPLDDRTHIVFGAEALPATVDFSLTPASGATLTMSDPIHLILLDLSSDVDIFDSGYRHIHAEIEDIPASWTAAWGTSPNPHASLNTTSPLGPVSLILSRRIVRGEHPGEVRPVHGARWGGPIHPVRSGDRSPLLP